MPRTPEQRFYAALDSMQDMVRAEMALIDLDQSFEPSAEQLLVSKEERQIKADKEKDRLYRDWRTDLIRVMSTWARARDKFWRDIKTKGAKRLEVHAGALRSDLGPNRSDNGELLNLAAAPGEEEQVIACPPGFERVDGICVPILLM